MCNVYYSYLVFMCFWFISKLLLLPDFSNKDIKTGKNKYKIVWLTILSIWAEVTFKRSIVCDIFPTHCGLSRNI